MWFERQLGSLRTAQIDGVLSSDVGQDTKQAQ